MGSRIVNLDPPTMGLILSLLPLSTIFKLWETGDPYMRRLLNAPRSVPRIALAFKMERFSGLSHLAPFFTRWSRVTSLSIVLGGLATGKELELECAPKGLTELTLKENYVIPGGSAIDGTGGDARPLVKGKWVHNWEHFATLKTLYLDCNVRCDATFLQALPRTLTDFRCVSNLHYCTPSSMAQLPPPLEILHLKLSRNVGTVSYYSDVALEEHKIDFPKSLTELELETSWAFSIAHYPESILTLTLPRVSSWPATSQEQVVEGIKRLPEKLETLNWQATTLLTPECVAVLPRSLTVLNMGLAQISAVSACERAPQRLKTLNFSSFLSSTYPRSLSPHVESLLLNQLPWPLPFRLPPKLTQLNLIGSMLELLKSVDILEAFPRTLLHLSISRCQAQWPTCSEDWFSALPSSLLSFEMDHFIGQTQKQLLKSSKNFPPNLTSLILRSLQVEKSFLNDLSSLKHLKYLDITVTKNAGETEDGEIDFLLLPKTMRGLILRGHLAKLTKDNIGNLPYGLHMLALISSPNVALDLKEYILLPIFLRYLFVHLPNYSPWYRFSPEVFPPTMLEVRSAPSSTGYGEYATHYSERKLLRTGAESHSYHLPLDDTDIFWRRFTNDYLK